jgi:drug/metabolite transporter (DMT)-like permease
VAFLEIVFCLVAVLCSSAGQLHFKAASNKSAFRHALPFWVGGIILMLVSTLLCVKILQTVALSALVPFAALAYITTPLGARLIFNEKLWPRFWLGTICISVGVSLTLLR